MEIRESEIHGLGCFAFKSYNKGEIITLEQLPILNERLINEMEMLDNDGILYDLRASVLRFLNHQSDNNAEWYDQFERPLAPGIIQLETIQNIQKGEEITINYRINQFK